MKASRRRRRPTGAGTILFFTFIKFLPSRPAFGGLATNGDSVVKNHGYIFGEDIWNLARTRFTVRYRCTGDAGPLRR